MNSRNLFLGICLLGLGIFIGSSFFQTTNEKKGFPMCSSNAEITFGCAMHPQIKQEARGNCPICGMHLTPQQASKYINQALLQLTEEETQITNIKTQTITNENLTFSISVYGKVILDESRVYHQVAHLPGRIDKLYVNEVGTYVRKGQRIASVYSKELIAVIEAFEYSKNSSSVVRSAENNLINWKVRKEQLKDFNIKKGTHRKNIDVYSDFSGIVSKKLVKEGDLAVNTHMGAPTTYFEIVDLSKVWVEFDLPEKWINRAKKGDRISFSIPAVSKNNLEGRIKTINPVLDEATRSVKVKIEINNSDGKLKPGMLAEGQINLPSDQSSNSIMVPESAVLWMGKKAAVYIKSKEYTNPVFEHRIVDLGNYFYGFYEIKKGVSLGEEIVVSGAIRIDAAAQLKDRTSIFNPPEESNTAFKITPLANN